MLNKCTAQTHVCFLNSLFLLPCMMSPRPQRWRQPNSMTCGAFWLGSASSVSSDSVAATESHWYRAHTYEFATNFRSPSQSSTCPAYYPAFHFLITGMGHRLVGPSRQNFLLAMTARTELEFVDDRPWSSVLAMVGVDTFLEAPITSKEPAAMLSGQARTVRGTGPDGPRPGAGARFPAWRPDGPRPRAGRSARARGRRMIADSAWISLPGGTPSGRRDPRSCLGSGRPT
jgi:hypothetical protein